MHFVKTTQLPCPPAQAYDWHARPGAFARLAPPWEPLKVIEQRGTIGEGDGVTMAVGRWPFAMRWEAVHERPTPGVSFVDVQRRGPFSLWRHEHRFEPLSSSGDTLASSLLVDDVSYKLPFGWLGKLVAGRMVAKRLQRMFDYRHQVTSMDLQRHASYTGPPLTIVLAGASGLVGKALSAFMTTGGHRVIQLVRRAPTAEFERQWDPAAGVLDPNIFDGVDAVVHLGGVGIGDARWTEARKQLIMSSRVDSTALLAKVLSEMEAPPPTWVCASAVGAYGTPSDTVDESAPFGSGFLADVCRAWEAATKPASDAGIRVVNLRLGVVVSPKGGALKKMLGPARAGLAGRVGSGDQPMSWVSLDDVVAIVHFILTNNQLTGPVNAVAPTPATNGQFMKALGRSLSRPTWIPLPSFAVRALMGEMGQALLLEGAAVRPGKLHQAGFEFGDTELETTFRRMLGR